MNQHKTGVFLRALQREKQLTQEQLAKKAECIQPDGIVLGKWQYHGGFSILVELEDFYAVDIHEIIDGERKSENMDQNLKETLGKVTEYAGMKQEEKQKKMNRNFLLGGLCLFTVICDRQFHVLSFIFRDPIANFVNGALCAMACFLS